MQRDKKVLAFAIMGAILMSEPTTLTSYPEHRTPRRKKTVIPKGCREFVFENDKFEVVYTCYAINEENAHKKFDKFLSKNGKMLSTHHNYTRNRAVFGK